MQSGLPDNSSVWMDSDRIRFTPKAVAMGDATWCSIATEPCGSRHATFHLVPRVSQRLKESFGQIVIRHGSIVLADSRSLRIRI